MGVRFSLLAAVLFSLVAGPAWAVPQRVTLKGHASLNWVHQKRNYRFDQIVSIVEPAKGKNAPAAAFETIDDFGNTVLRIEFFNDQVLLVDSPVGQKVLSSNQFSKLLSLPMGREEFLTFLLGRFPDGDGLEVKRDAAGRVVSVRKKTGKKQGRYLVSFADYRQVGGAAYPFRITFVAPKTELHLQWQELTLHSR